ncbi:MAG: MgtC/SapB family protein [Candidatus Hydrogenedentes bacterium]|nr:MgtC/SapB family protein [Candidatus Hydrogenedentota bacterium]
MSNAELGDVLSKLGLAVALAGVLGLERESKGRAAGLRTHILVCVASTVAMIVSDYIAAEWSRQGAPVWLDRGRIAAGIVTGIGFVGAGAIINVGNVHKGLTTAAMLWFVAVLGIAIGAGFYALATLATAIALMTVTVLSRVSESLPTQTEFSLEIRMPGGLNLVNQVEQHVKSLGYRVTASRLRVVGKGERMDVTLDLISKTSPNLEGLIASLEERLPEVQRITIER